MCKYLNNLSVFICICLNLLSFSINLAFVTLERSIKYCKHNFQISFCIILNLIYFKFPWLLWYIQQFLLGCIKWIAALLWFPLFLNGYSTVNFRITIRARNGCQAGANPKGGPTRPWSPSVLPMDSAPSNEAINNYTCMI